MGATRHPHYQTSAHPRYQALTTPQTTPPATTPQEILTHEQIQTTSYDQWTQHKEQKKQQT